MEDYIPITEAQSDPEGAVDSSLIKRLRDNPIAIAKGAAGAPKIQYAALDEGLAQQPAGGLGTYAFAGTETGTSEGALFGEVKPGSDFRPAGIAATQSFLAVSRPGAASSHRSEAGTALAGSWRCMGRCDPGPTTSGATLWLRIS